MNHLLTLTLTIGVVGHFISTANGACGADLQSSFDIVKVLCEPGNHEEDIARLIFGCYLGAQHKHLFFKCQKQTFGNTLGSKAHLENFCNQIPQLADYNTCLLQAFLDNGLTVNDLIAQGTHINGCQGDITNTCDKPVTPTPTTTTTAAPRTNRPRPAGRK